ncbi:hypothetical protein IPH70_05100 [Candidatus Roizmanbacteria bacterium]|nr:MAG: hypothetical protein IPH70_05100 [Candidatus Roizmanbacteria bacterium]
MVVEERIDVDFNHHGAHPSVDAIVTVDGTVEVQAIDAMVIRHDGEEVGFMDALLEKVCLMKHKLIHLGNLLLLLEKN